MGEAESLTGHLLIAMPGLVDPSFSRTVTFLCEHGDEGAMGIIVNRLVPGLAFGEVLAELSIDRPVPAARALPLHWGGPVMGEQGFVIHSPPGQWEATHEVTPEVGVTSSKDILRAMARGRGPERALVAFGYAGWSPGQLEEELGENSWLTAPADPSILFDTPVDRRLDAAARLLGIDLRLVSTTAGHA